MATPREELEELRALAAQSPREELEQLRQLAAQEQVIVPAEEEAVPLFAATGELPPGAGEAMGAGIAPKIVEPAATVLTGIAAEPIAGLAGLATLPFADAEKAEENIEAVREALTYIPRSPEGMAALQKVAETLKPIGEFVEAEQKALGAAAAGVPEEPESKALAGALAETVPAAALELTGLGAVRRATRPKTPQEIKAETPDAVDATAESISETKPKTDVGADIGEIKAGQAPETKTYEQITEDLKKKNVKRAAEQVMPDEEILGAAKDLNVDLNPSHYSTNRAFIDVEQSLKSRPGSRLASIEEAAIKELGRRADDLISDLGGETDKSLLDLNVRADINSSISALESKSDLAYKAVNEAIPAATRVKASASQAYLSKVLDELGGDKALLSSAEKQLLKLVSSEKPPTYAALDRIRKDVGAGFRKRSGPFKDDGEGALKQVYKVLSEDQQGVSDAFGVGADYAAARRLVASRKQLEDTAISLLGREMQGSIIPKITQAATSLTKGDVSKFNKLMDALPVARRSDAAATMLNDLFTLGARQKGSIGQGFMNAYQGLNRNLEAKNILFKNFPKDALRRFDNIGKVATGIFKSKALENTSKTARDIVAAMDDGGMFGKVYDVGRKAAVAEGVSTTIGLPGAGTAGVIGSALARKRTPATSAADELITSKRFKSAIEKAASTGDAKKADAILKNSPAYKEWSKHLSKRDAAQIATVGFIPWVTGQIEPPQEEEQ